MITSKPVRDNRPLEARADVLTFTTAPLEEALEAIGPVRVQLWVRGSEPHFDLFARVCDVDSAGASWNVCDALASVAPGRFEQSGTDSSWRVQFDLWPIAHRFAAGNRIRLQVSSGAHPRYVRNPGTGEDPLTAEKPRAVDLELLYGPQQPSSLLLPATTPGPTRQAGGRRSLWHETRPVTFRPWRAAGDGENAGSHHPGRHRGREGRNHGPFGTKKLRTERTVVPRRRTWLPP